MKQETEMAVRSILMMDAEVPRERVEKAIAILKGIEKTADQRPVVHTVRYKEAMEILNVCRRTLAYYVGHGYLDRVYGCGKRAIGVTRESLVNFIHRRVVLSTVDGVRERTEGTDGREGLPLGVTTV